jgi:catechol 2,3-dioxygenase-like lactoylglutathione lyase family enzyme
MDLLVNIDVDDLAKAIAFYEKALGLRVGRRFEFGVELKGARGRCGDQAINSNFRL